LTSGNVATAAAVGVAATSADRKEVDRIREKNASLKATMVNDSLSESKKREEECSVVIKVDCLAVCEAVRFPPTQEGSRCPLYN
jgi:hypothetical protein